MYHVRVHHHSRARRIARLTRGRAHACSGVGKTTVSRLVAKLYHQLGVSSKDKVVEGQSESTTSAQGEGAIEGTIHDYRVADQFATDFKFSRFDATAAKPRDVTKLTGVKRPRTFQNATGIRVHASDAA